MDGRKEAESGADGNHADVDAVSSAYNGLYLGESSSDDDAGAGDSDGGSKHADGQDDDEPLSHMDRLRAEGRFKAGVARRHRERLRREREESGKSAEAGAGAGGDVTYEHHEGGAEKQDVVARVKAFFYEELSFTDEFDAWARPRCGAIDLDSDEVGASGEHSAPVLRTRG